MALVALPFGVAIGLALGMFGGGGSVLAVPVLVYVLGQTVHAATTTSLMVVTVGAVLGVIGHARQDRVCWRHAAAFTVAALPGVVAGTALGNAVSGQSLLIAFAILMLTAAGATWRRASAGRRPGGPSGCPRLELWRDLVAGLLIGLVTGFFGIGGGFLLVPALAVAFAFSMRRAVATSLAIVTAVSIMGLGVHLLAGRGIDVPVTITMAVACAVGALAGAALAGRIPQRTLGRGFAVLVVLIAAYLLISAAFLGGPPAGA